MQFYPRFYFLDSRVADLEPMHLAWSFFGHGYGYQATSGVIELRRTTTLGACVLFAVMSNVVLVNVFFDVSEKIFSSVYLGNRRAAPRRVGRHASERPRRFALELTRDLPRWQTPWPEVTGP